jgi:IS5 family transposase
VLSQVTQDLRRLGVRETGREGLPAEAALRCALLKQYRQLSYQELAFHLEDSASFRAFARLPWGWSPKKSVLHKTISAIRAWEEINRVLLASARQDKVENGKVVRVDSTVTAALIHEPSDSSLLWDTVRVMVQLLQHADALGSAIAWHNHCRAAKKRARAIEYTRGRPKRVKHYRDLLRITRTTLSYLQQAAEQLTLSAGPAVALWRATVCHYQRLIERIIAQTERRVLAGEAVPAGEKLVSLFEPHADIIVKGSRDVQYGHKLNLTTGRSGLILDLVIEAGNPADSERLLPMLERHIAFYGAAPQQAAADGDARPNATTSALFKSLSSAIPPRKIVTTAPTTRRIWHCSEYLKFWEHLGRYRVNPTKSKEDAMRAYFTGAASKISLCEQAVPPVM